MHTSIKTGVFMGQKILVPLLLLAIIVFVAGCTSSGTATGTVVFTATDAAADMGTVSSLQVTIDEIQVHSASKGWVTVSSTPRTVDLLQLKAESKNELLASAKLAADAYTQMRFEVSKVMVTDAEGTFEAKLPSNEIKFVGNLVVQTNKTATATFDFLADESLHVTGGSSGNVKYVMAPVIQVTTRSSADVRIESNNRVEISGGAVNTNEKIGMDVNGNVGIGLKIPADAILKIDGSISIISAQGRGVFTITDAAADMGSVSKVEVTVRQVQVHSASQGWVTISTTPKTVDLLKLNAENRNELLADASLAADTYTQVRLEVEKVIVTDSSGQHQAKLPSNELKIVGNFVVEANKTTATTFDFIANESLHITGNSSSPSSSRQYIMAPVIRVTSSVNAQVDARASSDVKIMGGSMRTDTTVGMDVNGNVGVGLRIPKGASLNIDAVGYIQVLSQVPGGPTGTSNQQD